MVWMWVLLAGCGVQEVPDPAPTGHTGTSVGTTEPPRPEFESFSPYSTVELLWPMEEFEFSGFQSARWVPEDPVGLVFVFHGSSGGMFSITSLEWIDFYRELQVRNIAFVGTVSTDREEGKWETTTTAAENVDWQRINGLYEEMVKTTDVAEQTPVATVGFSNGGAMAATVAYLGEEAEWPVKTYIIHNSGHSVLSELPGFYVACLNDETGATPTNITYEYDLCIEAGRDCQYRLIEEETIVPEYFAKLPEFDEPTSALIVEELQQMEMVGEEGERLVNLNTINSRFREYAVESEGQQSILVEGQVRAAWALHRFNAHYKVEEADWLYDAFTQ